MVRIKWSTSIGLDGRHRSERVVDIIGMRNWLVTQLFLWIYDLKVTFSALVGMVLAVLRLRSFCKSEVLKWLVKT